MSVTPEQERMLRAAANEAKRFELQCMDEHGIQAPDAVLWRGKYHGLCDAMRILGLTP